MIRGGRVIEKNRRGPCTGRKSVATPERLLRCRNKALRASPEEQLVEQPAIGAVED